MDEISKKESDFQLIKFTIEMFTNFKINITNQILDLSSEDFSKLTDVYENKLEFFNDVLGAAGLIGEEKDIPPELWNRILQVRVAYTKQGYQETEFDTFLRTLTIEESDHVIELFQEIEDMRNKLQSIGCEGFKEPENIDYSSLESVQNELKRLEQIEVNYVLGL